MGKRGLFMFICPVALFKFHSAWYFETANTASLKRKHSVLTVEMKMEIVRALENRTSPKSISQKFEVARSWGSVSLWVSHSPLLKVGVIVEHVQKNAIDKRMQMLVTSWELQTVPSCRWGPVPGGPNEKSSSVIIFYHTFMILGSTQTISLLICTWTTT